MNGYRVAWKRIPLLRPDADWHVRIVQFETGAARSWDFVAAKLDADATFANTCSALTFDADNNGHFFTPPATLPPGEYVLQFVDASSPAVTDQWKGKLFRWNAVDGIVTWIGDL